MDVPCCRDLLAVSLPVTISFVSPFRESLNGLLCRNLGSLEVPDGGISGSQRIEDKGVLASCRLVQLVRHRDSTPSRTFSSDDVASNQANRNLDGVSSGLIRTAAA